MVFRMELTYHEVAEVLDTKHIATSSTGNTLPPSIYETSDIKLMLKSLLPNDVKVNITIDDIRFRSNLTNNKTIRFTKISFFYTTLGLIQYNSSTSSDIDGFVQLIPGICKSIKPNNITGVVEIHLKCNCTIGSILNGVREPILYSSALDKPPDQKIYKEPTIKLFKKINESVPCYISLFFLEDDGHKPVDFFLETINFTSHLIKI